MKLINILLILIAITLMIGCGTKTVQEVCNEDCFQAHSCIKYGRYYYNETEEYTKCKTNCFNLCYGFNESGVN